MNDLQRTTGSVIRHLRHDHSLTIKSLAERAGISVVYLGEIERGQKYPSASVQERLSHALGLSTADVLELIADELRGGTENQRTDAIGFSLPIGGGMTPRMAIKRVIPMLDPEEVTTIAELGMFFLSRRKPGEGQ